MLPVQSLFVLFFMCSCLSFFHPTIKGKKDLYTRVDCHGSILNSKNPNFILKYNISNIQAAKEKLITKSEFGARKDPVKGYLA